MTNNQLNLLNNYIKASEAHEALCDQFYATGIESEESLPTMAKEMEALGALKTAFTKTEVAQIKNNLEAFLESHA